MLKNHDKVTLKTLDDQTIVRYFPGASPLDYEIGKTLCPDDPHYGSALHAEGWFRWGKSLIAKYDSKTLGTVIVNVDKSEGAKL